jgi:hypothetical protein
MTVRQTLTAPLAGALQGAFAGGGLFGLFHEGGVVGERPPAMRFADPAVFEHARATTVAASPAPASCRKRYRSSPSAASWSCRPSGSCARRRRASSGPSPWWSTSPPPMRARSVLCGCVLDPRPRLPAVPGFGDRQTSLRTLQATFTQTCMVRKSLKMRKRVFDPSSSPSASLASPDILFPALGIGRNPAECRPFGSFIRTTGRGSKAHFRPYPVSLRPLSLTQPNHGHFGTDVRSS